MNAKNSGTYIGRLVSNPTFLTKKGDGKEFQARFTLAVQRAYKNKDGVYDYDYLPFRLTGDEKRLKIAHRIKLKDVLVISGDVRSDKYEKNGQTIYELFINADSISWAPRCYEGTAPAKQAAEKPVAQESSVPVSNSGGEYDLPFA